MASSSGLPERTAASSTGPSDEEVISRVKRGETALYEVIVRRYNQRLFRIVRSIIANDEEAQDVMQDAYVRAFSALHQFAGHAQFSTWLAKIAIYEAYRRVRKQKYFRGVRSETIPDFNMDTVKSIEPDPEQQTLSEEGTRFLEEAIDSLPEIYRSVFVLREIENMSTAETASFLEITEESVKVRLLRARHMLRAELYARAGATGSHAFQFNGDRCDGQVRNVLTRIFPSDFNPNTLSA